MTSPSSCRRFHVEDREDVVVGWKALEETPFRFALACIAEGPSLPNVLNDSISSDVSAPGVRRDIWLGVLAAMVLLLGTLQYLAAPNLMHWVYVLQRLYYIPIALAGLILGSPEFQRK